MARDTETGMRERDKRRVRKTLDSKDYIVQMCKCVLLLLIFKILPSIYTIYFILTQQTPLREPESPGQTSQLTYSFGKDVTGLTMM